MGDFLSEVLRSVEMRTKDRSSLTRTSVDAENTILTPSNPPGGSVKIDTGPQIVVSVRRSEESSFYESLLSSSSGHYRRDPQVAKRGFAVEFPLLCAKHGASLIPEVMVVDPETKEVRPLRAFDTPTTRYLGSMTDFMPSNVEISLPTLIRSRGSRGSSMIVDEDEEDEDEEEWEKPVPPKKPESKIRDPCLPPSPVVVVEFEDLEKQTNLKSFTMKGFEADKGIVQALGICFVWYSSLTHVILEKCKLDAKTLKILADHMYLARTVRELEIIDNPIPEQNFHTLLEKYTGLEELTLRKCEINDLGAELIAGELSYRDPPDGHSLRRLNLASNKIGDKGLIALADAMRTNRTLKELGLAKNLIGDIGAEAIANAAQKFALKSDEIQTRSKRSIIRKYLRNKRMKEVQAAEDATSSITSSKRKSLKGRRPSKRVKDQVTKEMKYDKHPYVWDARPDGVDLYCVGNVNLENINLGYNKISVAGVKKLLNAVRYQEYLKKNENRPERGLSNVELQGNPISQDNPELKRLQEILAAEKREDKTPRHLDTIEPKTRRPASKLVNKYKPTGFGGYYQGHFKEDSFSDDLKSQTAGTSKDTDGGDRKKKLARSKTSMSKENARKTLGPKRTNSRSKT